MNTTNLLANQLRSLDGAYVPVEDLEHIIGNFSFQATMWGSLAIVVLIVLGVLIRERVPKLKLPVFIGIVFTVLAVTLALIGSTVYLNLKASSGGPVHWHADMEIWACGEELNLRDPTGMLSNKIGTSTLHEHDDKRIHLEGVVVEERDASLGKFFYVVGGAITENALIVPLNAEAPYFDERDDDYTPDSALRTAIIEDYVETSIDGNFAEFLDGQSCPDGDIADVQVFAYEVEKNADGSYVEENGKKVYYQRKINNPVEYMINSESTVPDGDCLIIEFSPSKPSTDKKCLQLEVQDDQLGNYVYKGVKESL